MNLPNITADKAKAAAIIAGALAVGFVAWKIYKTGGAVLDTATDVVTKGLNPVSDQNYAYRATNAIGETISGQKDWSLGSWVYDITH